jgi:hypothetical protein
MRALRQIAGGLRVAALNGVDESERRQLLDTLRLIKANLLRINANGSGAPPLEAADERADDRPRLRA